MENDVKLEIVSMNEKLKKAVGREILIAKELENDNATKIYIAEQEKDDKLLPTDSKYLGYSEWAEDIEKQIARGKKALANIARKKLLIKVLDFYLENNS